MEFLKKYVLSQLGTYEFMEFPQLIANVNDYLEPFKLTASVSHSTEFEVVFMKHKKLYQYGFEFTPEMILNEWLYIDEERVYDREGSKLIFGERYMSILKDLNAVPDDKLYISILCYFMDKDLSKAFLNDIIQFFTQELNVVSEERFLTVNDAEIANLAVFEKLKENKPFRALVEKYIFSADLGIKRVELVDGESENSGKTLKTIHGLYDDQYNDIGEASFDLMHESIGTLRFMAYVQMVLNVMDQGGVLIVDELSARFHTLLTEFLMRMFYNENNTKAQLIFSTHDASLLDEIGKGDIFFIDKDKRGVSKIYPLSAIKRITEETTVYKDYIIGKFGAIPLIDFRLKSGAM
jgi:AAA15 family ATPase/GTPase